MTFSHPAPLPVTVPARASGFYDAPSCCLSGCSSLGNWGTEIAHPHLVGWSSSDACRSFCVSLAFCVDLAPWLGKNCMVHSPSTPFELASDVMVFCYEPPLFAGLEGLMQHESRRGWMFPQALHPDLRPVEPRRGQCWLSSSTSSAAPRRHAVADRVLVVRSGLEIVPS
jgi:hypothetical protein